LTRGCTVAALAWDEVPVGGIDLPARRLEMVWGFGSGLTRRADDPPGRVWAIGDRGPNLKAGVAIEMYGLDAVARHAAVEGTKVMPRVDIGPALAELQVDSDRVTLRRVLPLLGVNGAPATGLPPPGSEHALKEPAVDLAGRIIAPDPGGVDSEGVVALPCGGFVIADEYGPSLIRLDAEARIVERLVPKGSAESFAGAGYPIRDTLPAIAAKRRLNRGFEGVAMGGDGRLLVAFQSPLADPDEKASKHAEHVRLWSIDLDAGIVAGEYLYRFEQPETFRRDMNAKRGDRKLSEITALADGSFLVLERVSRSTKFFRVTLDGAGETVDDGKPGLEKRSGKEEALRSVEKTLFLDTDDHSEIAADLEGATILSPTELLLVNDNDFGCEGAVTRFWRVTFDMPVFG
jgi:hypothetical protein